MSLLGFFSSPWDPISYDTNRYQQHRTTMPKLMPLNSIVTELLSDDSDDERERVSEGWFHEMESSRAYKDLHQGADDDDEDFAAAVVTRHKIIYIRFD